MPFVDPLAIMLLGVAMSATFIAYYIIGSAKGKRNLANLAGPIFALGLFDFLSGFYMSFFWPLPGAYNMLAALVILVAIAAMFISLTSINGHLISPP